MMQRCIACERLEDYIAMAAREGDTVGQRVRARLLRDHQHGACVNRDWYTGHVRVAVQQPAKAGGELPAEKPQIESITLVYAGVWPGGQPAYTVHREVA